MHVHRFAGFCRCDFSYEDDNGYDYDIYKDSQFCCSCRRSVQSAQGSSIAPFGAGNLLRTCEGTTAALGPSRQFTAVKHVTAVGGEGGLPQRQPAKLMTRTPYARPRDEHCGGL